MSINNNQEFADKLENRARGLDNDKEFADIMALNARGLLNQPLCIGCIDFGNLIQKDDGELYCKECKDYNENNGPMASDNVQMYCSDCGYCSYPDDCDCNAPLFFDKDVVLRYAMWDKIEKDCKNG